MRQSLTISVFSFLLASSIGLLYWILRAGFLHNSIFIVVKVLGISAFILLLPVGFSYFSQSVKDSVDKVFLNDTIMPVYGIVLISILGYVTAITGINFSVFFVIIGYVLVILSVYVFFKQVAHFHKIVLIAIAIFFGLWTGAVCWLWYLKPYLLEAWANGTDRVDTLFHVTLAQMIKTYGVPTTGLDGIPPMTYHWGSHWFFAQCSNFLDLPVVTIYQLGFPVIIAPLLFRTFLSFIIQIKSFYKPESDNTKLNFFFWVVFLAVFIGFFQSHFSGNEWAKYSTGGTGSTIFMLISESYTVSVILMMAIFSSILYFWLCREVLDNLRKVLFLFIALPLLLAILGFIKISTLFVVCCLLGYLFIRLKMFKSIMLTAGMLLATVVSLLMFKLTFETKENHGSLSLLYFYDNWNISLPLFLMLFYVWTYVFIAVFIVNENVHTLTYRDLFNSNILLPVEIVLCVSIVGFIPSLLLRIQSFDALYFAELQMWISAALVLAYIPFYSKNIYTIKNLAIQGLVSVFLIVIFYINTKSYVGNVYVESIHQHRSILNEAGKARNEMRIRDIVKTTNQLSDDQYAQHKLLSFLLELQLLDKLPLEEKQRSLVYVDFRTLIIQNDLNWKLGCHNIALIVPALAGIAMIDGIDVTYYELCGGCCEETIEWVYGYYPKWKTREQLNKPVSIKDLTERVKKKGFRNLIYYNIQTRSFEKIVCN